MIFTEVTAGDFAAKVLASAEPAVVCFTCGVYPPKIRGEKARGRVWSMIFDASRQIAVRWFKFDLAHVGVGEEVYGVSIYNKLPVLVLFSGGKEVTRKTVLLREATARDAADRLAKWVTASLPPPPADLTTH